MKSEKEIYAHNMQGSSDPRGPGVEVTKAGSSVRYFPFFPNDQNSGYLYDIKFIFARCHRT